MYLWGLASAVDQPEAAGRIKALALWKTGRRIGFTPAASYYPKKRNQNSVKGRRSSCTTEPVERTFSYVYVRANF